MRMYSACICLLANLGAQDVQIHYLDLNKPHYVIGNKARVRSEAAMTGTVLAELPIGSEIIPIEQTSTTATIDGVEAPWYRVKFGQKSGFLWGNLIAKGAVKSRDGKLFLFGTGRKQTDLSVGTEYTSQIRVAKDGKELARIEIREGVGFMTRQAVKLTDGRGLTGVENIFVVSFMEEYCAGKNNKMFIFWTGKNLIHAHSSVDGADAPYYAMEKQIFPTDKGGRKGFVILEQESGDRDDPKSVKKEKILLKWNGKKLEKSS